MSEGERRIRSSEFSKGVVINYGEGGLQNENIAGPKLCLPRLVVAIKLHLPAPSLFYPPLPEINDHSMIIAPAPPLNTVWMADGMGEVASCFDVRD